MHEIGKFGGRDSRPAPIERIPIMFPWPSNKSESPGGRILAHEADYGKRFRSNTYVSRNAALGAMARVFGLLH